MKKDKQYISLKEASEVSGYSSDYIGQLIRKGKLNGKQVYSSVAWTVEKNDLVEYLKQNRSSENTTDGNGKLTIMSEISSYFTMERIGSWIFCTVIALMMIFVVFLIYIMSVNIEKRIERVSTQQS